MGRKRKDSTSRTAKQTAALERAEEARARKLARRLGEAEALAPLATDKPEVAIAPLVDLWPKRRALLIINSKSGPNHDSILHVRDLVDRLATFGIRADVRVKLRKSQARKEARAAAARKRYGLIIAAGGDGTVEAVASGLVGTEATLGIIPLGTYNNIATCLGIPTDADEACAFLAGGAPRKVDVGRVSARYMKRPRLFLEVGTVGLGAALGPLGQHVEKKRWAQAAQVLPNVIDMSPTAAQIRLDGEKDGSMTHTLLVTVSNSPRAGAGLQLAPAARMDDGLLDVCIYQDLDQTGVLGHFLPSSVGDAPTDKLLRCRARTVDIKTAQPMPVAIESKLVGVTPARFTVLTGALSVIAADGYALNHPSTVAVVRASETAARVLAPTPTENGTGGALPPPGTKSRSGLLQVIVPAAGRVLDTASSAGSIAVPLLAGAVGMAAAATLFRPRPRRFFR